MTLRATPVFQPCTDSCTTQPFATVHDPARSFTAVRMKPLETKRIVATPGRVELPTNGLGNQLRRAKVPRIAAVSRVVYRSVYRSGAVGDEQQVTARE